MLIRVCSKEQSYNKCNENLWFSHDIHLNEGEYVVPITATVNGFHTNYNEIDNLKKSGEFGIFIKI